jgi:UDP-GlcNAc3NAcA epimerase
MFESEPNISRVLGLKRMKIVTIVGARPQFIKAAAISRAIRSQYSDQVTEVVVHTGQHHDENMSKVFFDELEIPPPSYNLGISGGRHGEMTGRMLASIETSLIEEKPSWVIVYGDTNSTLAGAIAAAKLHIPVAHVEAGLRSYNMRMPEEINRIVTDRLSSLLLCPTETAVNNLTAERITTNVVNVGDVMYDIALRYRERAQMHSNALRRMNLTAGHFLLATCHRAENTDSPHCLRHIMLALVELSKDLPVVFPLHPRTRNRLVEFGLIGLLEPLRITPPLSFLDMAALEQSARAIITDSGGVQKEAYFYRVPCITMREETEWVETVALGWNKIVGSDKDRIIDEVRNFRSPPRTNASPYGSGHACNAIIDNIIASGSRAPFS